MINIGIIGAGIIGNQMKNRFLKEGDVNISWICDIELQKAKKLAENTSAKNNRRLSNDS